MANQTGLPSIATVGSRVQSVQALASVVGTVIKLDEHTASRSMGRFARVLVELNLKHDREEYVTYERAGHMSEVYILYERLPEFCKYCAVIGHATGNCSASHNSKHCKNKVNASEPKVTSKTAEPTGGTKQWVQRTFGAPKPSENVDKAASNIPCSNSFGALDGTCLANAATHSTDDPGTGSEIDVGVQVGLISIQGLEVQLPPIEDHYGTRNNHVNNISDQPQISDGTHVGSSTLPGPGLVIPEDNSSRPLQAMHLVAGERWGDVVDFAPPKHGDFNAVLGAQERISARAPNPISCSDFRAFIDLVQLFEIEAVGSPFTWATRRSSLSFIASKLDCVLAHTEFINHWDSVAVTILSRAASDHHPLLLVCDKGRPAGIRLFKFLNAWFLDSRFEQLVVRSWREPFRASDPISVGDGKVTAAKDYLSTIQDGIYLEGDSDVMMNLEIEATVALNQCLVQQHAFFAQKNHTDCLRDGDRNTTFFHTLHRIRKARAGLNAMSVDGVVTTDLGAISNHIVQFYSDLFRSSNREPPDLSLVHELISPASRANVRCLNSILGRYATISDQVFNPAKSKAYFGKHVLSQNRRYACTILGVGCGDLPFTYLGVPLF
ncbi:hypothetical protein ACS0TY_012905 [Phlomoides rotata]